MSIITQPTIVRTADNTIDLAADFNDLNLKAKTLADDVVAFVEAAAEDLDIAATVIQGVTQKVLADTIVAKDEAIAAKGEAEAARTISSSAAASAQSAANNAVAVVTGGTASLTPAAGKIPIAGETGTLDPAWFPLFLSAL